MTTLSQYTPVERAQAANAKPATIERERAQEAPEAAVAPQAPEQERSVKFGWKLQHLLLLAVAIGAVSWLAYQNRHLIDLNVWKSQLHWGWAALALVGSALTLFGNAWNLIGASPVKLRFWPTTGAQTAGTLARLISPAAVGAAAVNVQYLRKAGVGNVASVGVVSVAQSVQLVMGLILLPPIAILAGQDLFELGGLGGPIAMIVAGVILVLALAGAIVLRRSPVLQARVKVFWNELTRSIRAMAKNPRKAALSVAGSIVITVGLVGALWSSVHAFGGSLPLLGAACVLLIGSTAGNAIPIPGGLGTVDAALVATLGAAGVSLGVAIPAVGLFRLATLWLQLPVGLYCLTALRRRGQL